MKLSTAKRRINKTLDELTQSVINDWYANFKNGYVKGYEDARQGKAPMYAEAYKVADTPQTEEEYINNLPWTESDKPMDEYFKDHGEFYDMDCPWK